jgi:hypothetical protein
MFSSESDNKINPIDLPTSLPPITPKQNIFNTNENSTENCEPIKNEVPLPPTYTTTGISQSYNPQGYPPNSALIETIRDYLVWSIINVFIFTLGGLGCVFLSVRCRDLKKLNDFLGSKKFSKIALVSNVIVTIFGIGLSAFIIYYYYWYNFSRLNN